MKPPRRWPWWTWARRTTAAAFLTLLVLGVKSEYHWLVGSATSTRLFGVVPFADPLAALEVMIASRSLTGTLVLGAALLMLLAVLLGPVFCGWVCPLGFLLDLNASLRRRVAVKLVLKSRWKMPAWTLPRVTRALVLGAVVGFALVGRYPAFQTLSPINLVVWTLQWGVTSAALFLVVLAIVEWVAPRLWCRSLCPLGGWLALLGQWARLRIGIRRELAGRAPCHRCTLHCPMGIRVMEDHSLAGKPAVDDPDCTRCGSCLEVCGQGVLHWQWGSGPRNHESSPDAQHSDGNSSETKHLSGRNPHGDRPGTVDVGTSEEVAGRSRQASRPPAG